MALDFLGKHEMLQMKKSDLPKKPVDGVAAPKVAPDINAENAQLLQKLNVRRRQGMILIRLCGDTESDALVIRLDEPGFMAFMQKLRLLCFRSRWLGFIGAANQGESKKLSEAFH
jgi:hypothetical protein